MPIVQSPPADYGLGAASDADLDRSVEEILQTSDLNTLTKREIRKVLEEQFSERKATINTAINRVLLSHS